MSAPAVVSVQVGGVAPLGPEAVPSGFVKRPVTGPVRVRRLNLDGDAQADLSVHGGPDKAVYGYAAAQYPLWRRQFPEHCAILTPGAFGENLTIADLSEADICVGDVHAIGGARLHVTQPRQPCYKLALRMEDARIPAALVQSGRSGWYYRVLEEGALAAGDPVRLLERPNPQFPLTRLIDIVFRRRFGEAELAMLADAIGIAEWLRTTARRRLGRQD